MQTLPIRGGQLCCCVIIPASHALLICGHPHHVNLHLYPTTTIHLSIPNLLSGNSHSHNAIITALDLLLAILQIPHRHPPHPPYPSALPLPPLPPPNKQIFSLPDPHTNTRRPPRLRNDRPLLPSLRRLHQTPSPQPIQLQDAHTEKKPRRLRSAQSLLHRVRTAPSPGRASIHARLAMGRVRCQTVAQAPGDKTVRICQSCHWQDLERESCAGTGESEERGE